MKWLVHVSALRGKIKSKAFDDFLRIARGTYYNDTDKGVLFQFATQSEAEWFKRNLQHNAGKDLYADEPQQSESTGMSRLGQLAEDEEFVIFQFSPDDWENTPAKKNIIMFAWKAVLADSKVKNWAQQGKIKNISLGSDAVWLVTKEKAIADYFKKNWPHYGEQNESVGMVRLGRLVEGSTIKKRTTTWPDGTVQVDEDLAWDDKGAK